MNKGSMFYRDQPGEAVDGERLVCLILGLRGGCERILCF